MNEFKINLPETVEELLPGYLRQGLMPPERLFRMDNREDRFYMKPLDESGLNFQVAIGLTSAIPEIVATNTKWMEKWKAEVGLEVADKAMDLGMSFGTIAHLLINKYCKEGDFDFDIIADFVREYIPQRFLETHLAIWQDRMRKAMFSTAMFFFKHDVVPHFCEYPVFIQKYGLCHYLDNKSELTFDKARRQSNIDWKFLKTATFFEPHEAQAGFAKNMWNAHCDERGVNEHTTHTFLFAPRDYRKTGDPSYNLLNCTNNDFDKGFEDYMRVWARKKEKARNMLPSKSIRPFGKWPIGQGVEFKAEKHFKVITYKFDW